MRPWYVPATLVTLALLAMCALSDGTRATFGGTDPVVIGTGDIASCLNDDDEATAAVLDGIAGTVFTLGDNAYEVGSSSQFTNCYDPTWGRHKSRTMPAPGNHDYYTSNATGYYGYFGAAAGDPTKGYYSYDLGAWHIVVINSNIDCTVIACGDGSAQEQWLRADLAAHPSVCTLAYWHHPRFSSGSVHGNSAYMQPVWQALYDYGADVVLSGHEHNYERFAPQTPAGAADPGHGIREFVVGTGGKSHYNFAATPQPNSEVRNGDTYGVLQLTLHPSSYDWQFVPAPGGGGFTDSGSDTCHSAPAGVGGVTELAGVSGAGRHIEAAWTVAAGVVAAIVVAGVFVFARRMRV